MRFIIFLFLISISICLFPDKYTHTFSLDIDPKPDQITLAYDGKTFITWNNSTKTFLAVGIDGYIFCKNQKNQNPILQVIWPNDGQPFFLTTGGSQLLTILPILCTVITQIKNYDYPTSYNALKKQNSFVFGAYVYKKDDGTGNVTTYLEQYNWNTSKLTKKYDTDNSLKQIIEMTYSTNLNYLYVSQILSDNSSKVQVFDSRSGKSLHKIQVNQTIRFITSLTDQKGFIGLGIAQDGIKCFVYKFLNDGTFSVLSEKQNVKKIVTSPQANIVVLVKIDSIQLEVISLTNGSSLQNFSYFQTDSSSIVEIQMINTYLVMVDNNGKYISSIFNIPQENKEEQTQFPIWVILAISAGFVIILIILSIIFRKRLIKCFKKQQVNNSIKQPLNQINIRDQIQNNQVNNRYKMKKKRKPQMVREVNDFNDKQGYFIRLPNQQPQNKQQNLREKKQQIQKQKYQQYMQSVLILNEEKLLNREMNQERLLNGVERKIDWKKIGYDLIDKDDIIRAAYFEIREARGKQKLQKLILFKQLVNNYLKQQEQEKQRIRRQKQENQIVGKQEQVQEKQKQKVYHLIRQQKLKELQQENQIQEIQKEQNIVMEKQSQININNKNNHNNRINSYNNGKLNLKGKQRVKMQQRIQVKQKRQKQRQIDQSIQNKVQLIKTPKNINNQGGRKRIIREYQNVGYQLLNNEFQDIQPVDYKNEYGDPSLYENKDDLNATPNINNIKQNKFTKSRQIQKDFNKHDNSKDRTANFNNVKDVITQEHQSIQDNNTYLKQIDKYKTINGNNLSKIKKQDQNIRYQQVNNKQQQLKQKNLAQNSFEQHTSRLFNEVLEQIYNQADNLQSTQKIKQKPDQYTLTQQNKLNTTNNLIVNQNNLLQNSQQQSNQVNDDI